MRRLRRRARVSLDLDENSAPRLSEWLLHDNEIPPERASSRCARHHPPPVTPGTSSTSIALGVEPRVAQPDGSARKPGGGAAPILRRLLVLLDVLAVAVAWTVALVFPWGGASAPALTMTLELLLVVVVCLAAIAAQRLYLARVCGVRAVEVARLGRASMVAFAGAY